MPRSRLRLEGEPPAALAAAADRPAAPCSPSRCRNGRTSRRTADSGLVQRDEVVERLPSRRQDRLAAVQHHLGRAGTVEEVTRHRVRVGADVAQREDVARLDAREPDVAGDEVARVGRVAADVGRELERRGRAARAPRSGGSRGRRSARRCSRRWCPRRRSAGRRGASPRRPSSAASRRARPGRGPARGSAGSRARAAARATASRRATSCPIASTSRSGSPSRYPIP